MLNIRPLESGDFLHAHPLLVEMKHVLDGPEVLEARFSDFCSSDAYGLLGAELDGVLVGYALAQDYGPHLRAGNHYRTARLHDLFVLEQYRKQGVARALLNGVKAWCRARPIRFLEWQAGGEALGFYQRLGYQGEPCPQPEFPTFEVDFSLE